MTFVETNTLPSSPMQNAEVTLMLVELEVVDVVEEVEDEMEDEVADELEDAKEVIVEEDTEAMVVLAVVVEAAGIGGAV